MIKNKLIKARKEKYTQQSMAKILHMTQSQYQRREKGDIKISDEEWERMAKALNTTVEDIKEEDISPINNNYCISEFILKNMEDYISLLKNQIEEIKSLNPRT
ncbi:transcriptional regulator with XRE-family HTH domain [Chryseobacterium vietnamense]|uniref:Transcriptional regulator with XRE-family HTH domain n=1 Tax=Chryseobacterium vietnamense TaxID=866785 RepID=A0ACC6J313_9FLAO|nr:helix-turn-helix transcriptional regulator [Chryseobacterium vietnamense]MDR6457258.1 transcriptional regulator with XRE-family HTH domain [Chryseobacterium vietnamense]